MQLVKNKQKLINQNKELKQLKNLKLRKRKLNLHHPNQVSVEGVEEEEVSLEDLNQEDLREVLSHQGQEDKVVERQVDQKVEPLKVDKKVLEVEVEE